MTQNDKYPIFIEFNGQNKGLAEWLFEVINFQLNSETGIKVEKAFPNDQTSTTLKVRWHDD